MIEYWGPHEVAAEAKMMRSQSKGAIVLVEGESDFRFLKRFLDADACKMVPARGKTNAVEGLAILESEDAPGMLAFIDADYDRITGTLPTGPNIIVSDYHDVEVMLFISRALDDVLQEYASERKVRSFLRRIGAINVRSHLFNEAARIGWIRYVNNAEGWALRFNDLDFKKIVDARDMKLDQRKAILAVIRNSDVGVPSSDDIRTHLERYVDESAIPVEEIVVGHDLSTLLAIALRQAIGSHPNALANPLNVERLMRLAYGLELFVTTDCYRSLKRWEEENAGYILLAA